ncbi:MAG: hypothetical protein Q4E51_08645 [Lachnospiraceae bacterium]|nr:hypothetical protein [Lachnospiraceae bacterium]
MVKHWIKLIGTNQYNGNVSWNLSYMRVPAKHELAAGDQFFCSNKIYTLKEVKINVVGNTHYYWDETERDKNVGYPGVFKKGK